MIASDKLRVLIVDDHAIVREPLAELLSREPDLVVIGCAASADEAIAIAREEEPDVILMDIDMPGLDCFAAAATIRANHPDIKLVFLSAKLHDHFIDQALTVAASGYLTKGETPERIASAIREVASGGACYSMDVMKRLVIDANGVRFPQKAVSRLSTLTLKECEILRYIARGLGKKRIAEIMCRSVKTVDSHTTSIMQKLDIHDRVELTLFAIREGLV